MHQDFMKLSDQIAIVDKQAQQQLASSFRQLQDGQNKAMQMISEGAETQHAKYNTLNAYAHEQGDSLARMNATLNTSTQSTLGQLDALKDKVAMSASHLESLRRKVSVSGEQTQENFDRYRKFVTATKQEQESQEKIVAERAPREIRLATCCTPRVGTKASCSAILSLTWRLCR